MRLCLKSSLSTNKKCEVFDFQVFQVPSWNMRSLRLESSISRNIRNFFKWVFYLSSSGSSFQKYKKMWGSIYGNIHLWFHFFNLGARMFHFQKYKNFLTWELEMNFRDEFFYFSELELKSGLGSPMHNYWLA